MGKKEYNCILRFMEKDEMFFYNVTTFLREERLISKDELVNLSRANEKAKYLLATLDKIQKDELVMLVDWEWTLLPVERMKLTIITDNSQKEFAYGH